MSLLPSYFYNFLYLVDKEGVLHCYYLSTEDLQKKELLE